PGQWMARFPFLVPMRMFLFMGIILRNFHCGTARGGGEPMGRRAGTLDVAHVFRCTKYFGSRFAPVVLSFFASSRSATGFLRSAVSFFEARTAFCAEERTWARSLP